MKKARQRSARALAFSASGVSRGPVPRENGENVCAPCVRRYSIVFGISTTNDLNIFADTLIFFSEKCTQKVGTSRSIGRAASLGKNEVDRGRSRTVLTRCDPDFLSRIFCVIGEAPSKNLYAKIFALPLSCLKDWQILNALLSRLLFSCNETVYSS